ncbi:hypothetical protein K501DRAFT_273946 [Backusella circina FSU 941]|nr:hypothetical protein K501DRAFT_273946 [Backusella circina FSU 941]
MDEDLLKEFVHDEPPPNWDDIEDDLDQDTDIFQMEEERREDFKDEYEDEDEWTDIIKTEEGLYTEIRKVKDDLEEPVWEKGTNETTWDNGIDDLLRDDINGDDSNWEEITEIPIPKSKVINSTATAEGNKSTSTKASSSVKITTAPTSKSLYSKTNLVTMTKSLSIIPNLHVAKKEKPTSHTEPTASSSWSIIAKASSLATLSKTIHISLSSIVESATAEDVISSKVNVRTTIPTSVVDILYNKTEPSPSLYSSSLDMPGSYPYEYSPSFGGMGYIGVFSDDANGIHHSNSLSLLLLIFTLVLLFFHD